VVLIALMIAHIDLGKPAICLLMLAEAGLVGALGFTYDAILSAQLPCLPRFWPTQSALLLNPLHML
jgi:hypothetical protein